MNTRVYPQEVFEKSILHLIQRTAQSFMESEEYSNEKKRDMAIELYNHWKNSDNIGLKKTFLMDYIYYQMKYIQEKHC